VLALLAPLALSVAACRSAQQASGPASRAPGPVETGPLLWRIEGPVPSWAYGTIHLPDARVLELPEAVRGALGRSDVLVAETPLEQAAMQQMAARAMLPEGESLREIMPPDLYERTGRYLAGRGLPIEALSRVRVWALSTQLVTLDYLAEFATAEPLDARLWSLAADAGKRLEGLETLDEQLAVFESLTLEEQLEIHGQTLDLLERAAEEGRSPARELVDVYLTGDAGALMDKMDESFDPGSPAARKLRRLLLDERNARMAERIAERIEREPETSFFFAVGAAHLPGEGGVAELLEQAGYEVSRGG
jgi:uncharacterized protein YbaP (TraB family)